MADQPTQTVDNVATAEVSAKTEWNPRLMALKSAESRRKQRLLASQVPVNLANASNSGSTFNDHATIALESVNPSPELLCARAQLDKMNAKLSALLDDNKAEAIDLERVTRSVASLREQVRILSGIPLPGSHKPMPQRAGRRSSYDVAEPQEPQQ